MPIAAGTRFGSYDVIDALGAGGMGEVYRARDTSLKRDVAIKVLPPSFALDENLMVAMTGRHKSDTPRLREIKYLRTHARAASCALRFSRRPQWPSP